jgi:hypothetical protein
VAGIRFFKTVQAPQKSAFTGTGRTTNHHDFSGGYFVGNIHQRLYLVGHMKGLVYVLYINHDVAILFSSF